MADEVLISCPDTPGLTIPHLGIQFVEGVARVSGDLVPQLAAYQRHHGVIIEGPDSEGAAQPDDADDSTPDDASGDADDSKPDQAPAAKRSPSRSGKPFG